jgi:glutathione S-transferase
MRLHRFPTSGYSRYVQAALDLARVEYTLIDVPFGNREELARLTGGYIKVPVLEKDDGSVLKDSKHILQTLLRDDARFAPLVPPAEAGPIWAYADWVASDLEDVAFRIAAPALAQRFSSHFERALFVFVKERKFGPGCVDVWELDQDALFARLQQMLAPTAQTLAARPFVFGKKPTLADAALYGMMAMLDFGAPERVAALGPEILGWKARLESEMGPPPYGRVARAHRPRVDIERVHQERSRAPREDAVAQIVVRPGTHERKTPAEAVLDPTVGLVGDRWHDGGKGKPGAQIAVMDARVAHALADREDWPLAGDNLIVDHDLASLKTGDRLRIGAALVEVTDEPHHGCRKFSARFGPEALRWVNDKQLAHLRLRGLYVRVLEGATIRVGDRLART